MIRRHGCLSLLSKRTQVESGFRRGLVEAEPVTRGQYILASRMAPMVPLAIVALRLDSGLSAVETPQNLANRSKKAF